MKAARLVVLGVAIAAGGFAAYLASGGEAAPAGGNEAVIRKSNYPDAIEQFTGSIVRIPIAAGEPIGESGDEDNTRGGRTNMVRFGVTTTMSK